MSISSHLSQDVSPASYIGAYHSTTGIAFTSIMEERAITARKDRNQLVFLFYGKPAYSLKKGGAIINEVSIAANEIALGYIHKSAPFDTGGLDSGKYAEFFAKHLDSISVHMILEHLRIGTSVDDVCKYVTVFFGDNNRYTEGSPNEWLFTANEDPILRSLAELFAASQVRNKFDPPASTVELQVSSPYLLNKESTNCVIFPFSYFDRPEVVLFLQETGIKYATYEDEVLANVSDLWSALIDVSQTLGFGDENELGS